MSRELDFNRSLIDYMNDIRYSQRIMAVTLGGTSGSGGGNGGPPGGFNGQLPQTQVAGDTDELRVLSSGSATSLLWNLNRIRYWLTNQISNTPPSPTFAGQIWVDGSSGSTLNVRNETDTDWIVVTGGGGGGTLDPNSPQDVGASAVVGSSGSAAHGNHVHRGVHSVSTPGGAFAYGDVVLQQGANVTITQSSGSLTISSTGGGEGVPLDATSPADVGATAVVGSSGSAAHGDHVHRGVSSVSAAGGAYAYGNVQLLPGTNISLSQSSGSITINNTQGAGGITFDPANPQDVGNAAGVGTSGSAPHADHIHKGIHGVFTSPNVLAYGDIDLVAGSGITITQSSGSFTFATTGSLVPIPGSSVNAYGDSITLGTGTTDAAHRYTNIVATTRGWTLNNTSVDSQLVIDMADQVYATTVAQSSQAMALVGFNDNYYGGADSGYQTTFQNGLMALLAWLAIPNSGKISSQNTSAITYTGTWTNGTYYPAAIGRQTNSAGTATFTLGGRTLYIAGTRTTAANASFSVTVDGVSQGTYSCSGETTSPTTSRAYGPFLIRLTGFNEGPHTIVLTYSGSGYIYFDWAASADAVATTDGPNVWVGNTLRMNATGYAVYGAASDATTTQYNAIIHSVITTLAGDGLQIAEVLASEYYNPQDASQVYSDNVHPNDTGHVNIAAAFLHAMDMRVHPAPPSKVNSQAIFTTEGVLSTGSGSIRIYNVLGRTAIISKVFLAVDTAPTGSAIICDIHKGGTTIFTAQGNRPQIAAGTNTGYTAAIDVPSWADGEYLTFDRDQVGSTVPGSNLTVHIVYS